jgi:outer membrane protein assembly factor BamB
VGRHSLGRTHWWEGGFLALAAISIILVVAFIGFDEGDVAGKDSPRRSPGNHGANHLPHDSEPQPINTKIEGLTTFRGNATRTYYGEGPVPSGPEILWEYPDGGGLCSTSFDQEGERLWCGTGWTGQPNVIETAGGKVQVRFGAYDGGVHILDGETGRKVFETFPTGDLIKGTVTSDPDGLPLLYTGSRDNLFRVLALDRGPAPVELWSLSSESVPNPVWNNDWDGSALIIDDFLIEGGENSWLYVVKLNRARDARDRVTVDPKVKATVTGFDDRLLSELGDDNVSIEGSVAYRDGVVYFANSGGLVQGWDVSKVLAAEGKIRRTFRFWTGDDTDATVVIDDEGYLYVASELERFNARSAEVGQLMKLDPNKTHDPLVWSLPVPAEGGSGGLWATPALYRAALFAPTNSGRLLAVDRERGRIAWEMPLPGPLWSSPVVVDDTLIVGDCAGVLHAYDVHRPLKGPPPELWTVPLPGCIESTPAVWKGMIYVGTRGGKVYGIGDPQ